MGDRSYIAFSTIVSIVYVLAGYYFIDIYPDNLLLAAMLVVICSMIPSLDSATEGPAKELGGIAAAVSPFVVLQLFPELLLDDVAGVSLIVILTYVISRLTIVKLLHRYTEPRGLFHSIPAAILVTEIVYMLYWELYWVDRVFLSGAALCGYLGHLMLDAYNNFDIVGQVVGKPSSGKPTLKFWGSSAGFSFALYAGIFYIGYFVVADIYPQLHFNSASTVTTKS